MMFVTLTTILASANMFGQSYLMTKGAPGTRDPHGDLLHRRDRACRTPDGRRPRGRDGSSRSR